MFPNLSESHPIVGFIYLIVLIIVIVYIAAGVDKQEKKRRKEIEDYCLSKGLNYYQDDFFIPYIVDKCIFCQGETVKRFVCMNGTNDGLNYYIFEQLAITPGSRNATTLLYTFCVIIDDKLHLPNFTLIDKDKIINTISKVFGGKEITFADYPEFSNKLVLNGEDDNSVKKLFSTKLRKAFVHKHTSGLRYQGMDNCFIILKEGKQDLKERLRLLSCATYYVKEMISKESDNQLS